MFQLTIRLARVPHNLAAESRQPRNHLYQVFADLERAAQVHRLAVVVAFRREHAKRAFRRVLDVEKFARRRTVAPDDNVVVARFFRVHALLDQRGDHVAVFLKEDLRLAGSKLLPGPYGRSSILRFPRSPSQGQHTTPLQCESLPFAAIHPAPLATMTTCLHVAPEAGPPGRL